MKALVKSRPEPGLWLEEVPVPEVGIDDVQIRVRRTGICGTDLHLILFDRTSSYHELTSTLFREVGVVPRGVMELDTIDVAKKMVEQGLGVALLPYTAVAGELATGRLASVQLRDANAIRRRIVAVRRRDAGPPSGLVASFLESLSNSARCVASRAPE